MDPKASSANSLPHESVPTADLDKLVCQILAGAKEIDDLLAASQTRLKRLITVRFPEQLRARLDPEDVLQETLVVATRRFPEYADSRSVPVFVWLRGLALERLVEAHRFHLGAAKRDLNREQEVQHWLDQSTVDLLQRVATPGKTPSQVAIEQQRCADLKQAIQQLPHRYREALVLRFYESLTVAEAAAALDISIANAKVVQYRALQKLQQIILEDSNWDTADREQHS